MRIDAGQNSCVCFYSDCVEMRVRCFSTQISFCLIFNRYNFVFSCLSLNIRVRSCCRIALASHLSIHTSNHNILTILVVWFCFSLWGTISRHNKTSRSASALHWSFVSAQARRRRQSVSCASPLRPSSQALTRVPRLSLAHSPGRLSKRPFLTTLFSD